MSKTLKYNKLVRDKIPQIIKADGKFLHTKKLGDEEFLSEVIKKLNEECAEFIKDKNIEELADVKEVVQVLAKILGGG